MESHGRLPSWKATESKTEIRCGELRGKADRLDSEEELLRSHFLEFSEWRLDHAEKWPAPEPTAERIYRVWPASQWSLCAVSILHVGFFTGLKGMSAQLISAQLRTDKGFKKFSHFKRVK